MTDTNVVQLSQPETFADPLTEVLRNGARALLVQAVEAEVAALLDVHADKLTDDGHRRLVRHRHLPEREIMTGIALYADTRPPSNPSPFAPFLSHLGPSRGGRDQCLAARGLSRGKL